MISVHLGSFFISLGQKAFLTDALTLAAAFGPAQTGFPALVLTAQHLEPYNLRLGLIRYWSLGAYNAQERALCPNSACPLKNLDHGEEHLVILPTFLTESAKFLKISVF